jgi:optic atrophy 3 protein
VCLFPYVQDHCPTSVQNYIKRNAQDHERFRKLCVSFAQNLHRIDTRLRLGLLQDPQILARNIAREVAEAETRRSAAAPVVAAGPKTEAQAKRDSERIKKEIKQAQDKASKTLPRVRPLTEAKAIETGANFISETFLFCVAGAAIVFEYWRSKRKESTRRDEVSDRLDQIELKIDRLELRFAGDGHAAATVSVPSTKAGPADKASGAGPVPQPTRVAAKA